MRAYFFGNYYLSAIQQGIQSTHCIVEIQQKYRVTSCSCILQYEEWARKHKTVVLLNGGNQADLIDLYTFLQHSSNLFPFGFFKEDEQSLNSCVTCVGIILPARIYDGAKLLRDRLSKVVFMHEDTYIIDHPALPAHREYDETYNSWEIDLMSRLNTYRLA